MVLCRNNNTGNPWSDKFSISTILWQTEDVIWSLKHIGEHLPNELSASRKSHSKITITKHYKLSNLTTGLTTLTSITLLKAIDLYNYTYKIHLLSHEIFILSALSSINRIPQSKKWIVRKHYEVSSVITKDWVWQILLPQQFQIQGFI